MIVLLSQFPELPAMPGIEFLWISVCCVLRERSQRRVPSTRSHVPAPLLLLSITTLSDQARRCLVVCKSCGATNQNSLSAEMAIHVPGIENLDRPTLWVFPRIVVCMNCGFSEFFISKDKLQSVEVEQRSSAATAFGGQQDPNQKFTHL